MSWLSAITGMDANKKASKTGDRLDAFASRQMEDYSRYSPMVYNALLTSSGINPQTGNFDESYNPYGVAANSIFNQGSLVPEMAAYKEMNAGNYDSAVARTKADLLDRGFVGASNSMLDANVGAIRRAQAQDNGAYGRTLLSNLLSQKRNFLAQGIQQRGAGLGTVGSLLSGSASQGLGTLGGLQGMYGQQAAQGLNSTVGAIGTIGKLFGVK